MDRSPVQTNYPHVAVRSDGELILTPSQLQLTLLMEVALGQSWGADQLLQNYPQLTASEVFGMLTYYHDHREQVDAEIARRDALDEADIARHGAGPFTEFLREARMAREARAS